VGSVTGGSAGERRLLESGIGCRADAADTNISAVGKQLGMRFNRRHRHRCRRL
jgi:hypothetical protein